MGLRDINDIDIVVSLELWEVLSRKYGSVNMGSVTKIVFPDMDVEAFREGSFGEFEEQIIGRRVRMYFQALWPRGV